MRRRAAIPSRSVIEGVCAHPRDHARMISRPLLSPPAWTMRRREWAASRPSSRRPSASRSKGAPSRVSFSIAAGAAARIARATAPIAKPVAGFQRIGEMQGEIVVGPEAGGDAALRQHARRLKAKRRLAEQQHRHRRQRERGRQAGETAADDDARAGGVHMRRLSMSYFTASMRSTARRAGAAMRGIDRRPHAAWSRARAGCCRA